MKSKDKVLKIFPESYCRSENNNHTIIRRINEDTSICLSYTKNRESSAWADAYKNLKR